MSELSTIQTASKKGETPLVVANAGEVSAAEPSVARWRKTLGDIAINVVATTGYGFMNVVAYCSDFPGTITYRAKQIGKTITRMGDHDLSIPAFYPPDFDDYARKVRRNLGDDVR